MRRLEENKHLIGDYIEIDLEEPVYKEFISRQEFINRTGIYISIAYYSELYEKFTESGVSVEEFVQNYESKYATCICKTPLKGVFKYEFADNAVNSQGMYLETDKLNIWEQINCLDVLAFRDRKTLIELLKKK